MTNEQFALYIISIRGWPNGALLEFSKKALRGEEIVRSDTTFTEKEWAKIKDITK